MSDLTAFERRKLELLGMESGYVLNFSDRTYAEFFIDYRVEIDAAQYRTRGDSKAKRMRAFWDVATNSTVGRAIEGLMAYGTQEECLGDSSPALIDDCRKIAQRLLSDQPVVIWKKCLDTDNSEDNQISERDKIRLKYSFSGRSVYSLSCAFLIMESS